jgi:hypothetical protein
VPVGGGVMEKRAVVQGGWITGRKPGTISWSEHISAWKVYNKKWNSGQSAERINERGGFSYDELVDYLGHDPKTWRPQ